MMKATMILISLTLPLLGFGQNALSMNEVEERREVAMSDTRGKRSDGKYRYYAKGETKPFTGVLFANYPNGQTRSWQEYENGIGQGKWINYYENGHHKEIGHYNQDRVEGPIQKFYENGQLKAEGHYKDWRIKIGKWKYYQPDGTLKTVTDYGTKGSIEEVKAYYQRGDISYRWYADILSKNGFDL
ncbi:MAG: hypothetical protein AAF985_09630 [Bacteroidota bacterium]